MADHNDLNNVPGYHPLLPDYVLPLALIMLSGILLLFTNLGVLPLWGSEGRWAVISRYMFQSVNLGCPMLGQNLYWDKPLLSYWQVLPCAFLFGKVNEFVARIPSALWALVLLFLTFDLTRRWFDLKTATFSCGILLSSYGFVFWGRNAQVEMTNAAIIMVCLWYFLLHRSSEKTGWVYVLGIIMGLGGNMKGLTVYAVPIFCILVYSWIKHDWSWLPPIRTFIFAAMISLVIFLIIPAYGIWESQSLRALEMVWHENIARYFVPFDHKGPLYTPLLGVFELGAPWSLLLLPALIYTFRTDFNRETPLAGVISLLSAIFIFFSMSGSRRTYYLLPVLPFLSIIIGDFLVKVSRRQTPNAAKYWVMFTGIVTSLLLIAPFVVFLVKPDILPLGAEDVILILFVMSIVGILMLSSVVRCRIPSIICLAVMTWGIYVLGIIPIAAVYPDNIRVNLDRFIDPDNPIGFLHSDDAKLIFYLNRPYKIFQTEKSAYDWAETSNGILFSNEILSDSEWKNITRGRGWAAFQINHSPRKKPRQDKQKSISHTQADRT